MKTFIITFLCSTLSFFTIAQDDCTLSDSIYSKTEAQEWSQAFKAAFDLADTMNRVKCPIDLWNEFLGEVEAHNQTQARCYFLSRHSTFDEIPGIAIVPSSVNDCYLDTNQNILLMWRYQGEAEISDSASIQRYLNNWNTILNSDAMENYAKPYAFNYRLTDLQEPINADPDYVTIWFGLSDVNADDSDELGIHPYVQVNGCESCNSTKKEYIDYSMPCPNMCGQLSNH